MLLRHRLLTVCAAALGAAGTLTAAAPAAAGQTSTAAPSAAVVDELFPTEIALPDGFQPEGIAIGILPFAFFGSRLDGDLYRVNLVTGKGTVFSQGPGTGSLGMKLDLLGRLFVAGGPGGDARVVNAVTGTVLASYRFAVAPTFVNDVILTPDAAWFTDSLRPQLYKVPLGQFDRLPGQSAVVTVPLTGAYQHQTGFNANGIARTPDGTALLIVQSNTGLLFRVNPATGATTLVDLGGQLLTNGDGLLREGRTLYAVQNQLNRVAVIRLDSAGTAGEITGFLTHPRFDIPTTAAAFGDRLYLPNARFNTPPTPTTTYTAVAVEKSLSFSAAVSASAASQTTGRSFVRRCRGDDA
jgi:sugar lactone lactonase YvrE